ncbi:MAG: 4-(cytidine 5'-diphospho)-2-C-methyl-D-erythritol kinase [Patescibacteria group bacterium]|nr:4-(cytidine 5'-diphospho)-2-C-methyl-D-erythritol kinase [Patescibacteria group bacterium]
MKKIQMTAPAKLNLCLEVVKKYPDGFHEIRSIMVKSQNLYDTVVVEFNEGSESISIECDNPDVPTDEQNICWKIAQKYFAKINKRVGVKVIITKRIPMLAGLGGGSSDGASVLLALNEYFGNPHKTRPDLGSTLGPALGLLSMDELVVIASEVGKDIPFFLQDAFGAYVSGAGEDVESLFNFPQLPVLVVNPNEEIGTPWAYGQLDQRQWFMEDEDRKNIALAMKENHHTLDDIVQYVYNDFAFVAQEQCYVIGEIKNAMQAFGARVVSISGKGPTVFGIFESTEELEKTKEQLQKQYPKFFVSKF